MTKAERFRFEVKNSSSNAWGWAGTLTDRLTGNRYPVLKHASNGDFAFNSKSQLISAARRLANSLGDAA